MDEVMDTQRSYVTYPKPHSMLVAALGLTPHPLAAKFSAPSCCNPAPFRVKVIRWMVEVGNGHQAKKSATVRAKGGGQERRKEERAKKEAKDSGAKIQKERVYTKGIWFTAKEHILP